VVHIKNDWVRLQDKGKKETIVRIKPRRGVDTFKKMQSDEKREDGGD